MNLYFTKYNNYYNRIVKKETYLADYLSKEYEVVKNVNFDPCDGVNTTKSGIFLSNDFKPDYLLVSKQDIDISSKILTTAAYISSKDYNRNIIYSTEDVGNCPYISDNTFNLYSLANYNNPNYETRTISIEFVCPLDEFTLNLTDGTAQRVIIWSDYNSVTIEGFNGIVDKDKLNSLGWENNEDVWGIEFYGSSPDSFDVVTLMNYKEKAEDLQKWFIVENKQIRKADKVQCEIQLRRDLISENYNEILNADVFIEKATLQEDNPLIFNNEDMTYNQIKQKEVVINDKSCTAWAIGYLANNREAISGQFGYSLTADINLNTINHTDWTYYNYVTNGFKKVDSISNWGFYLSWWHDSFWPWDNYFNTYTYTQTTSSQSTKIENTGASTSGWHTTESNCKKVKNQDGRYTWFNLTTLKSLLTTDEAAVNDTEYSQIRSYHGKKIQFADGMYECIVDQLGTSTETKNQWLNSSSNHTAVDNLHATVVSNITAMGISIPEDKRNLLNTNITYTIRNHTITLRKMDVSEGTANQYTIPVGANQLIDAPYTMFAIPFYINGDGAKYVIAKLLANGSIQSQLAFESPEFTENWLESIIKQCGSNLYDLQILPYCPIPDYYVQTETTGSGAIRFIFKDQNMVENVDYTYLTNNGYKKGIMFFPKKSTLSFQINNLLRPKEAEQEYPEVEKLFPVTNVKIQSETQMCRLVSPNYSGAFEFNLAKNGGLKGFNVDITYKPYNPYIQIAPIFDKMYGQDFNDSRGLICTGDFSFPAVVDNWKEYEIQNKNYLNSFNRQIENMDTNNAVQREKEKWSAISGTVQGAGSGAITGAMAGGAYGAAAGAVVGGVASGIGGMADMYYNEKLRTEALEYTKDQFGYALGNIKALPYTLSKTSSLNAVSKYFPFVEIYDCTEKEKEALRNKLKFNGMTVMTIDKIGNYLQTDYSYIKGKLIRLENSNNDFHEINAISGELDKGVFIK